MPGLMERLTFWYWREYKHKVHPYEIAYILKNSVHNYKHRKYQMAIDYSLGFGVEKIAQEYNVTMTRVETTMWSIWHQNKRRVE